MLSTGNYLVPHLGAEAYSSKPPILFWFIALCSKPYGAVTDASARMPSAFAAIGVLLLTYFLGQKLYKPFTGFVSALILFTSLEFFVLATSAHIDMLLTLWITFSLVLFYYGFSKEKGARWFYLLSYFFMGMAVLTKGPVGLFIPLIAIVLFLVAQKEFKKLREIKLIEGLLIVLGVVCLWLVPACIEGGIDFTKNILMREILGRIVNSYSHKAPFYYYLLHFPGEFIPWTFFIPSAALFFWRQRHRDKPLRIMFPLLWFLGGFIFLSCISSKRNIYLLPLYPAAALMMGKFIDDIIHVEVPNRQEGLSNLFKVPLFLMFGSVAFVCIFVVFFTAGRFYFAEDLQPIGAAIYPAAILLFGGCLLGIILTTKTSKGMMPFLLIVMLIIGIFAFSIFIAFPATDKSKTARAFFERVETTVGPENTLLFYRFDKGLYYFLNRKPLPEIKDLETIRKKISGPDPVYYVVDEETYQQAPQDLKQKVVIRDVGDLDYKKYYLLMKPTAK
jgi:4-amino-4-deoxy-L-arabinose transferase-like glycosyltransferase